MATAKRRQEEADDVMNEDDEDVTDQSDSTDIYVQDQHVKRKRTKWKKNSIPIVKIKNILSVWVS